ncbi:uncharacterized protein [Littorina saxatilis]|uniref:uncharacterized protein isoform X2 n=1 Tax=Littorina saxatilis TaxID=31220 RepID=UPI0038B69634
MDYACCHRLLDVICEVCRRNSGELSSLQVPHARLAGAALYKMVVSDSVREFPTAVLLAQQLFVTLGSFDNSSLVRCYAKLLCGLKVKVLFHSLVESASEQALCLLRQYFPHGGDEFERDLVEKAPKLAEEIQKAVRDFRRCFLPLVRHKHKRESFMENQFEELYGAYFTRCLARRAATFLAELEKDLPATFIDELLQTESPGKVTNAHSPDFMVDVLLNCVEGKSTLQATDLLSLLEDLSPHSSPNLEGFCNSFIAASHSGSTVGQSANSQPLLDTSHHHDGPSSDTSGSDILIGPEPMDQGRYTDLACESVPEGDTGVSTNSYGGDTNCCGGDTDSYSDHSHPLAVNGGRKQQENVPLDGEKGWVVGGQRSTVSRRDGEGRAELPPCYVKLSYQKNLLAFASSTIQTKMFA